MAVAMWLGCLLPAASPGSAQPNGEPIRPIGLPPVTGPAKVALGEALFIDRRLSRDDSVACASCHALDNAGDDGRARPTGLDGQPLPFNSPSVFNAALSFRLNWRGNFRSLEEQNEAAMLDPHLMGASWPDVLAKLNADPDHRQAFLEIYGGPPDRARVLDALAAFQRTLVTPNARFDRYLGGEGDAITAEEEEGYRLFKSYGCIACHQGVNVGGNLFQLFGIFSNPFSGRPGAGEADLGRFTITGDEADRHVFRVPSLRNVAVTAPYFHDGRTASLTEAVNIMAQSQLGRAIPPHDVRAIVKFLETLTGEFRGRSLAAEAQASPP